jgi:hypothetical protein
MRLVSLMQRQFMIFQLFGELFFLERRHFVAHFKALVLIDLHRRVGVFQPLSVSVRVCNFFSQIGNFGLLLYDFSF